MTAVKVRVGGGTPATDPFSEGRLDRLKPLALAPYGRA
jgi:hypothetical protein